MKQSRGVKSQHGMAEKVYMMKCASLVCEYVNEWQDGNTENGMMMTMTGSEERRVYTQRRMAAKKAEATAKTPLAER